MLRISGITRALPLLIVVCILIPTRAFAQCCRIEGVVRSDAGVPVSDATISLTSPDIPKTRTMTSGADGRYVFDNIKPGIWVGVHVIAHGLPAAESFTLVTRPVETLDIIISSAPTAPASAEDLKPMGGESGELRGTVRTADGEPVAGAHVGIANTEIETTTDEAGRYSLGRIRALLTVDVSASATGYAATTKKVSIPTSGRVLADFALAIETRADEETGLGVFRSNGDRQVLTMLAPQLSGVPSLAPADLFRALELLPVAGIGDESELYVRGSATGDARITLDDIPWFPSSRLAGAIGAPLNTAYVQETELSEGRLDSPAGGEMSSAIHLNGRPLTTERVSGTAEVNMFGASGSAAVPIAKMGSISFGARHSLTTSLYTDLLNTFSGPDMHMVRDRVPSVPGAAPLSVVPSFSDVNARLDLTPGRGNRITASVYNSNDDGNFSQDISIAPSTDVATPPVITVPADAAVQIGDAQTWTGRGVSAAWMRQWSPILSTSASVAQSRFSKARQQSVLATSPTTGGDYNIATGIGGTNGTAEANEVRDTDVHAEATIDAGFTHAVTAGIDAATLDTSYNAQIESLVHAPNGTTSSALLSLLAQQNTAHLFMVFGQDSFRPMARLTLSPGVRFTHDDLTNTSYVDPRITASYVPAPRIVVKATWSIDHQPLTNMTREDRQRGDSEFWTLSDGAVVPVPRADQFSVDATFQMAGVLLDMRGYYRMLTDLTMFAPRVLPGAPPPPGNSGFYAGTGTAAGFELLVQHRRQRNNLWAAYTFGHALDKFPALETGSFPPSFDRRNQFRFTDAFSLWKGISVTGVMVAGTGAPYTSATTAEPVWFANGDVAYQPLFGPKNASTLPAYQRLDLSGQIEHRLGAVVVTAGATVFNVYDHPNVSYYDFEVVGPSLVTSPTTLMRRAVNAFLRVRF